MSAEGFLPVSCPLPEETMQLAQRAGTFQVRRPLEQMIEQHVAVPNVHSACQER
jgi:hypothetical protein